MTTNDQAAFYVSTHGNDNWSGRLTAPNADGTDGPFASLERARDAMRSGDVDTTYVRGGTYRLDQTLTLDHRDDGHSFSAYRGETPVLSGGERVTGFTNEGNGLFSAKLSTPSGLDLSIGGERQHVAQSGDYDSADVTGGWHVLGAAPGGASKTVMSFHDGDIPSGLKAQDGLAIQTFDTERLKDDIGDVRSIDHGRNTITLDDAASYALRSGGTYRLLNDDALIRDPGEFAWRSGDGRAEDGRLVVKPQHPDSFESDGVVVARLGTLVSLKDASGVTLKNLTFADGRYDGAAVTVTGGHDNEIGGNHFVNVGTAVALDGADRNRIAGNEMEHLGNSGVTLVHAADGNAIYANRMEHIGEIVKGGAGVGAVGSSDTLVSHNDITDAPRYGVSFKEWDDGQVNARNMVEFNRIHHAGQETADGGGIEMLGRSSTPMGSTIRGNEVIDSGGLATNAKGDWLEGHKGWGISLDDLTSGVNVRDNFVSGASWASIYVHGGDQNLVENNFGVIDSPTDSFVRVEWVPKAGDEGKPIDNTVTHNLAVGEQAMDQYWKLLTPGSLTMDGNVTANAGTYGPNDRSMDPGFTDPAHGDYSLTDHAPALSAGIHDLSWSSMGTGGYEADGATPYFWAHAG